MFMKKQKRMKAKRSPRPSRPKLKESKLFEVPVYGQEYEFMSSAASIMMVLKYLNKHFKLTKDEKEAIYMDAIGGSVWHGSRYGIAYALAKRGASPQIFSNVKDAGYEKKLAVYEGINLETLTSAFDEIKKKTHEYNVKEQYGVTTVNTIKKQINQGRIPIVLVNLNALNPGAEPQPHWVVVKGYDKDTIYVNDPYSDSTVELDPDTFKSALGYDSEHHMISVSARNFKKR